MISKMSINCLCSFLLLVCLPLVFVLSGFSIFFLGLFLRVCMCFVLYVVLPFLLVFSLFAFFFPCFSSCPFFYSSLSVVLVSLCSFLVGWIIQPAARGSWSSLFCWGTVTSLSVFCVFCLCCVRSLVLFLVQCSCYWRWRPGAATEDEVRARCRNTMISTFVSLFSSFVLCSFRSLWFIPQRLDLIALINEIEAYR
jgi:hypothetical protein